MAKEYIPRKDVINDIGELFTICRETLPNECGHHFIVEDELQSHLDFVRNLPAADVVEVRHGHWIWELADNGWANHICSECGYTKNTDIHVRLGYEYCPICGAKMDGGQEDA